MKTSEASGEQLSLPSISSVEVSLVKTSQQRARELACKVLAAAYGLNTTASFRSFARDGWWSRMSPAARISGLTLCSQGWEGWAMRRYRSRLQRLTSGHHINASASLSLLPTLTATGNMLAPSMRKWPRHRRLLPTLVAHDANGTTPAELSRKSPNLPCTLGGHLNPTWCEWFMGFPLGWTDVMREFKRSGTALSLNAPRLSGG